MAMARLVPLPSDDWTDEQKQAEHQASLERIARLVSEHEAWLAALTDDERAQYDAEQEAYTQRISDRVALDDLDDEMQEHLDGSDGG